jgi:hypothetical protein
VSKSSDQLELTEDKKVLSFRVVDAQAVDAEQDGKAALVQFVPKSNIPQPRRLDLARASSEVDLALGGSGLQASFSAPDGSFKSLDLWDYMQELTQLKSIASNPKHQFHFQAVGPVSSDAIDTTSMLLANDFTHCTFRFSASAGPNPDSARVSGVRTIVPTQQIKRPTKVAFFISYVDCFANL